MTWYGWDTPVFFVCEDKIDCWCGSCADHEHARTRTKKDQKFDCAQNRVISRAGDGSLIRDSDNKIEVIEEFRRSKKYLVVIRLSLYTHPAFSGLISGKISVFLTGDLFMF